MEEKEGGKRNWKEGNKRLKRNKKKTRIKAYGKSKYAALVFSTSLFSF